MAMVRRLFVKQYDDSAEAVIHAIGIDEPMPPCIVDRPKGVGDYLFMHFHDPAVIADRTDTQVHAPNSFMVWDPRHGHYYGNPLRPWTHSWVHCAGERIGDILRECAVPLNTPFPQPDPSLTWRYLYALYREVSVFAHPDPVIVGNTMHCWMREVCRVRSQADRASAVPTSLLACMDHLTQRYAEQITLHDLAAMASMSVSHFCTEFRRHFGQPAMGYLTELRMQHAVYLLRDRNLRITEIAPMVGYRDLYQFSRAFRRRTGISPSAMRERLCDGERSAVPEDVTNTP